MYASSSATFSSFLLDVLQGMLNAHILRHVHTLQDPRCLQLFLLLLLLHGSKF